MDDDFDDQGSYASENDNSFQNILRDSRISNMTEESIFFERLYQTSQKRLLNFKEKYQNDFFFMDEEKFKNIFVEEEATYYHSPFSAIFHYCFNPSTNLPNSGKSFFETIFQKRGDKDYSISYRKDELQDIPKFFDDISYSNNLFDNFDINRLFAFLDEVVSWKETFKFVQIFNHPLNVILNVNSIQITDTAIIYFISPCDLIIDYYSKGDKVLYATTFTAVTQYRFHCDITFNKGSGGFIFHTSYKILNTTIVQDQSIEEIIVKNSYSHNKKEIQENIWPPLKTLIQEVEDQDSSKNKENKNKIILKVIGAFFFFLSIFVVLSSNSVLEKFFNIIFILFLNYCFIKYD